MVVPLTLCNPESVVTKALKRNKKTACVMMKLVYKVRSKSQRDQHLPTMKLICLSNKMFL